MIYNPNDPRQLMALYDLARNAKDQGKLIDAKIQSQSRSNQQNKYYQFVLRYYASQIGFTRTDAEKEFKELANPDKFVRTYTDKKGKVHTVIRSSADLSKEEMDSAIRNFISYAEIYAGVAIPYESDKNLIFECQKEIDKVKNYI